MGGGEQAHVRARSDNTRTSVTGAGALRDSDSVQKAPRAHAASAAQGPSSGGAAQGATHHMKRHEFAKKTPVQAASRRMSASSATRAVRTERSDAFIRAR